MTGASPGAAPAQRLLDPSSLGDHLDRLYRAAWGLCGSREDAEDLVQETIEKVLRKPRMVRGHDDLGYLMRALRNTFHSRHRTSLRRPQTADLPEGVELPDHRAGTRPDRAYEAREVFEAIAALPPAFRETLVAVDVAGLSYAETAVALGTREGTVMSRLYRARQGVTRSLAA